MGRPFVLSLRDVLGPALTATLALASARASAEPARPARPLPALRRGRIAREPTYGEMVRQWHTPPAAGPSLSAEGRPALALEAVNTGERVELSPERDDGGFSADDLSRASHLLRDPHSDEECAPDARLLDLVYRIARRFEAKVVRIVSAFRSPRRHNSRHGLGRAIDLVVPGTTDAEVARFARSIGFVGVGLYPRSGFVHLDSRARSYFWVDSSAPGRRGQVRQVLAAVAAAADAKALARGETPPDDGEGTEDGVSSAAEPPAGLQASAGLERRPPRGPL